VRESQGWTARRQTQRSTKEPMREGGRRQIGEGERERVERGERTEERGERREESKERRESQAGREGRERERKTWGFPS
jgi:hypothetical protein